MIPVTKTFLPPIEAYMEQVQRAYANNWLTNRGELVKELEEKLKTHFQVPHVLAMCNGTLPIQIALKLLGKKGEVITTPFSYVATTSSIVWENCSPVFVDIHPDYLTIDESKIEAAITPKTTCILATHVYGNPCNVEVVEQIAKKHNLKVIYDAAHCFGVRYKDKSIFSYGDVSTCSFHATKLFHCGEGGAAFCNDAELFQALYYSHNFGHRGPLDFEGLGINAKISELQAGMGLAVWPYLEQIVSERKKVVAYYRANLDFSRIKTLKIREHTDWNYSYYPIIFESEAQLLAVQKVLNDNNIVPRRYFYPSLNTLPYLKQHALPHTDSIAPCVLCLPLYVGLTEKDIVHIVSLINANYNNVSK